MQPAAASPLPSVVAYRCWLVNAADVTGPAEPYVEATVAHHNTAVKVVTGRVYADASTSVTDSLAPRQLWHNSTLHVATAADAVVLVFGLPTGRSPWAAGGAVGHKLLVTRVGADMAHHGAALAAASRSVTDLRATGALVGDNSSLFERPQENGRTRLVICCEDMRECAKEKSPGSLSSVLGTFVQ